MTTTYKILGQLIAPGSSAWGTLSTPSTQVIVSTITISNQTSSASTYNIAIAASATSPTAPDATILAASVPIAANSVVTYTLGITLESGKYIRVMSPSTSVGFMAFGSELS